MNWVALVISGFSWVKRMPRGCHEGAKTAEEKGGRSWSWVEPGDRTRGGGRTLGDTRLCLGRRRSCFVARVTRLWHRLPEEPVESPCSEIFTEHLDVAPGSSFGYFFSLENFSLMDLYFHSMMWEKLKYSL